MLPLLFLLIFPCAANIDPSGPLVISEVMYHPLKNPALYSYLEIFNRNASMVDLSDWYLYLDGVPSPLPVTTLDIGEFLVLARNPTRLLEEYPGLNNTKVFQLPIILPPKSALLALGTALSQSVSFTYSDDAPWSQLADGFGCSLELQCWDSDPDSAFAWHASPPSQDPERQTELMGSPGLPNFWWGCPAAPSAVATPPTVFFSEIMINPVDEDTYRDVHQFVEILNVGNTPISLEGWTFVGLYARGKLNSVTLNAGEYGVIAANISEFEAVYSTTPKIVGSFVGELKNNDKVLLLTNEFLEADFVNYDLKFPWPVVARGETAGIGGSTTSWSTANTTLPPVTKYQGYTLSRWDYSPTRQNDVSAWEGDFASPGRANFPSTYVGPVRVVDKLVRDTTTADQSYLLPSSTVIVSVRFSGTPVNPRLEWFRDAARTGTCPSCDIATPDPFNVNTSVTAVPLVLSDPGSKPWYAVSFPADTWGPNSVIRWRVVTDRNGQWFQTHPRANDPYAWDGFFIRPLTVVSRSTRWFHFFFTKTSLARLQGYASGGRVSGCNIRPDWNYKQPGIVVTDDGRVIDVEMRQQGSRYNRYNGDDMTAAWYNSAASPSSYKAYSFRVSFPSWDKVDGSSTITFHKIYQGCTYLQTALVQHLSAMSGLASIPDLDYARIDLNGAYYRYTMMLRGNGKDSFDDFVQLMADECPRKPVVKIPHQFKSQGVLCGSPSCGEGPFGDANEQLLSVSSSCPQWSQTERHFWTYQRKTNSDKTREADPCFTHACQMNMCRLAFGGAGATTPATVAAMFDVKKVLIESAIQNYGGLWDESTHNKFWQNYQEGGKWWIGPWDADGMFGEYGCGGCENPWRGRDAGGNGACYGKRIVIDSFPTLNYEIMATLMLPGNALNKTYLLQKLQYFDRKWDRNEYLAASVSAPYGGMDPSTCYSGRVNWINSRDTQALSFLSPYLAALPADAKLDICPDVPDIQSRSYAYETFSLPRPTTPYLWCNFDVFNETATIDCHWSYPNPGSPFVAFVPPSISQYSFEIDGTAASTQLLEHTMPANFAQTYSFRVRAESNGQWSSWSNTVSVRPMLCLSGQSRSCPLPPFAVNATQTCNFPSQTWNPCIIVCPAGYDVQGYSCLARACSPNGAIRQCDGTAVGASSAQQTCVGGNWAACTPSTCLPGRQPAGSRCDCIPPAVDVGGICITPSGNPSVLPPASLSEPPCSPSSCPSDTECTASGCVKPNQSCLSDVDCPAGQGCEGSRCVPHQLSVASLFPVF